MNNHTTAALLEDYARHGCEKAFTALVERFLPLVYGTALRRTGRAALAADAVQEVFTMLARRAGALSADDRLGAWLHRRTVFAAADIMKSERRRKRRESIAAQIMQDQTPAPDQQDGLSQAIDEALQSLPEPDRIALTLRYLEGRSAREAATALGISAEAAQKRTARALERLRYQLARRGAMAGSASVIASLLTPLPSDAIPPGLVSQVSAKALSTSSGGWFWKWWPPAISASAGAAAVLAVTAVPFWQAHERRITPSRDSSQLTGFTTAVPGPFDGRHPVVAGPAVLLRAGMTLEDIVAGIALLSEKAQPSSLEFERLTALLRMVEQPDSLLALELLAKRVPGFLRMHDALLPEWHDLIGGKAAAISSAAAISWVRAHVSPEIRPGLLASLLGGGSLEKLENYWPELLTKEASLVSSNRGNLREFLVRAVRELPPHDAMDTLLNLSESYSPEIPLEALAAVVKSLRINRDPGIWSAAWDLVGRVDDLRTRKSLRDSIVAGMSVNDQRATREWLESLPEEVRRSYAAQTLPWVSGAEDQRGQWWDKAGTPDWTPHMDWLASVSPGDAPGQAACWCGVAPEQALAWLNEHQRYASAAMKSMVSGMSCEAMPEDAGLREAETAKAAQRVRPFVHFWQRTAPADFEAFRAGIVTVGQREIVNLAAQP